MWTASSAMSTWSASRSASEKTATVLIPILRAVLITRQAISPRLAIRIFLNITPYSPVSCCVEMKAKGFLGLISKRA